MLRTKLTLCFFYAIYSSRSGGQLGLSCICAKCLPVPNAAETISEQASVAHSLCPNSEVLLMEMEASTRLVAHLVGQSLQLFRKRRCATVEHPCRRHIASEAFLWILRKYFRSWLSRLLPTVEFGCLEEIRVKTSFQLGLAKCVLTCAVHIKCFRL